MIELHITKTAKSHVSTDHWQTYDNMRKSFPDLSTAHAWLKEEYGKSNHNRRAMYQDTLQGPEQIGYVIGFKNYDWNMETGKRVYYIEQH